MYGNNMPTPIFEKWLLTNNKHLILYFKGIVDN